jgi:hypothetical protein
MPIPYVGALANRFSEASIANIIIIIIVIIYSRIFEAYPHTLMNKNSI